MAKLCTVLGCGALALAAAQIPAAGAWARAAPTPVPAAMATVSAADADYRIGADDTLEVAVFQVPDLSRTVQVDAAGKVLLPLIGQVDASGQTTAELSRKIAAQLGEKYLKDPQVTVTVKDSTSQKVTIDGAVTQPGIYPLTGPTTLLQAVALAKGPDPKYANTHKVSVFRIANGQRIGATYNLDAIRDGKQVDPAVYPRDVVVVAGSGGKSFLQNFSGLAPFLTIFRGY